MIDALAWVLIHFLWQGTLLGLLAWRVLGRLRHRPDARYSAGVGFLAAMALAPVATITWLLRDGAAVPRVADAISTEMLLAPEKGIPAEWILALWAAGVTVCSARLAGGWWVASQLARTAVTPVGRDLDVVAASLARLLHLRRAVPVLASARVRVPMMVGWLRPVVLLPVAAVAHLTVAQLEALIAHEYAHVRRHDYLVNLCQSLLEAMLFYHPAIWWVSRQVRDAREQCCDDLAVGVCDRLTYVSALSTVATYHLASPAIAASGGALRSRVARLVRPAPTPLPATQWLAALPVTLVIAAALPVAGPIDTPPVPDAPIAVGSASQVDTEPPQVATSTEALSASAATPAPPPIPAVRAVIDFAMPGLSAAPLAQAPPPPSREEVRPKQFFFVNGEVATPGQKPWEPGMTVGRAVALSGGMTARGMYGYVNRPMRQADGAVVRYVRIQDLSSDTLLLPDDELIIGQTRAATPEEQAAVVPPAPVTTPKPAAEPQPGSVVLVAVAGAPQLSGNWVVQPDGTLQRNAEPVFVVVGEVTQPGRQRWEAGLTVGTAVARAGGMTSRGKLGHIKRQVVDEKGNRKWVRISGLRPDTEVLENDEIVIAPKWFGGD